jgi:hypothetical protein
MYRHLVVHMFGNQHTQEQHNKNQARTTLRAFFLGYTLLDMVFLMMFISLFSLTLKPYVKPNDIVLEDVLIYKKKLDSYMFSCMDQALYVNEEKEDDVTCHDFDTYIEVHVSGYMFYAIKRE